MQDSTGDHYVTAWKDGRNVGNYHFVVKPRGLLVHSSNTHVDHRRKGLASAAYQLVEHNSGMKIVPRVTQQSPAAKKLWNHRLGKADPQEHPMVSEAKKHFGTTKDMREAGYIMPGGEMLDFSGRHYSEDHPSLAGHRNVDHRDHHLPHITGRLGGDFDRLGPGKFQRRNEFEVLTKLGEFKIHNKAPVEIKRINHMPNEYIPRPSLKKGELLI